MSRLLEINPSEILAAISKHHGLRSLARSTLLLLRRTKENLAHKLALSLRGNVSLPRLSRERDDDRVDAKGEEGGGPRSGESRDGGISGLFNYCNLLLKHKQ